jgi:hypothetical protein
VKESSDGWFITTDEGGLNGNGKECDDLAGGYDLPYEHPDHVGVLLDLDDGSLCFFKGGVKHGPGYPAGSVTGPVVHAAQLFYVDQYVRLIQDAQQPRQ